MIWHDGTIYLFTRDRSGNRHTKVYSLPDTPGEQVAKLVGEYRLSGEVTDAALSPDGNTMALLGREKLFIVDLPKTGQLLGGTARTVELNGAGQTEGLTFISDRAVAITTEKGHVYRYEMP